MDPVSWYRDKGYWLHKEPLLSTDRFQRLDHLLTISMDPIASNGTGVAK